MSPTTTVQEPFGLTKNQIIMVYNGCGCVLSTLLSMLFVKAQPIDKNEPKGMEKAQKAEEIMQE